MGRDGDKYATVLPFGKSEIFFILGLDTILTIRSDLPDGAVLLIVLFSRHSGARGARARNPYLRSGVRDSDAQVRIGE